MADLGPPAKQAILEAAPKPPPQPLSLEHIVPDEERRMSISAHKAAGATYDELLAYLQRKRFEVDTLDLCEVPSAYNTRLRDVVGAFKGMQHLSVKRPFTGPRGTLTDDVFPMCTELGISQLTVHNVHRKLTGPGITGFLLGGASTGRKRHVDIAELQSPEGSFIIDLTIGGLEDRTSVKFGNVSDYRFQVVIVIAGVGSLNDINTVTTLLEFQKRRLAKISGRGGGHLKPNINPFLCQLGPKICCGDACGGLF